jgi:hypothetical protein
MKERQMKILKKLCILHLNDEDKFMINKLFNKVGKSYLD